MKIKYIGDADVVGVLGLEFKKNKELTIPKDMEARFTKIATNPAFEVVKPKAKKAK